MEASEFEQAIRKAINCHSMENGSNTPDFLLARYLCDCLDAYNRIMVEREKWYGNNQTISGYIGFPSSLPTPPEVS